MKNTENEMFCLTPKEAEYMRELLAKNRGKMRNAVRSVLGRHFKNIGEDCLSEISLLAIKKVKKLIKHNNPDGWLLVASKKVAANYIRKEYTRLKNAGNEILYDIPTSNDSVHEDALYNIWMENNSIEKLLETLTPREKEVYDLLYKQRMTSKQAGAILGISDSTVRTIDGALKNKIKYEIKKLP